MLGYLLVLHCIYSSYEYNQLNLDSYNKSDLALELAIGLILIFISTTNGVLNQSNLTLENEVIANHQYLQSIKINQALSHLNEFPNEYLKYDNRVDFMDIKKIRHNYQEYLNKQ